jgi:predicted membrane protein
MPVQGQEPFEEDLEWLKYGREIIKDSPRVLDEAAKGFLALGSTLLTVYTGALALFKLNEKASAPESWAIICIPIVLWLLCISCLAYVYFPDRCNFHTNSPSEIEKVTRDISQKKSLRLKIGSVLFVAALAATSISIVWLGAQVSSQSQQVQTVQFVIPVDKNASSQNISMFFENRTQKATSLALLEKRNQTASRHLHNKTAGYSRRSLVKVTAS